MRDPEIKTAPVRSQADVATDNVVAVEEAFRTLGGEMEREVPNPFPTPMIIEAVRNMGAVTKRSEMLQAFAALQTQSAYTTLSRAGGLLAVTINVPCLFAVRGEVAMDIAVLIPSRITFLPGSDHAHSTHYRDIYDAMANEVAWEPINLWLWATERNKIR